MDQVALPFDAPQAPVAESPIPPAPISETRLTGKRGPFLVNGELLTMDELAKRAGVGRTAMKRRLRRVSAEEALRRPPRQRHEIKPGEEINGMRVLEEAGRDRRGARRYKVECFCPKRTIFFTAGADLRRGNTKSCGCRRSEAVRKTAKARLQDLTDQTFSDGAVRALRLSEQTRLYRGIRIPLWECLCSWCDTTFQALAADLKRGAVTSCGCHGGRDAKRREHVKRYPVRGDQLTLAEARRIYGIPRSTMRRRMDDGATPEQIVAGKLAQPAAIVEAEAPPPRRKKKVGARPAPVFFKPVRVEADSYREITPEMEADLIRRSQAGDRVATTTLVMAHDAFLRDIAGKWAHHGLGAEFDDILQEQRISFLRSLKTADPAKGSLITYAGHLAVYKAKRTVECDSRTVRVPCHVQQAARKAVKLGATTPEQIRELVGCPTTAEDVAMHMRTRGQSVSLDAPVGDPSDSSTYLDLLADGSGTPEDHAAAAERQEKLSAGLKNAMTGMTRREIDVLRRRASGETLQQIAKSFDVSRERIRQIEKQAKTRLRFRAGKELRALAMG